MVYFGMYRTVCLAFLICVLPCLIAQSAGAASIASAAKASAKNKASRAEESAKALQGTNPPEWQAEHWLNSAPLQLQDLRGKVVLVRWWTANCRYCKTTAPALRDLHKRYPGLSIIGMYHHKEESPFDPKVYEETTQKYGFEFPVAFDPDWRTFHSWMRDAQGNRVDTGWTSVTFVLDKKGVVRYVHPGGSYVKGDADYKELTAVLEQLLN